MDLRVVINLRSDVSISPPLSLFDNEICTPYIRLFLQIIRARRFSREEARNATKSKITRACCAKFLKRVQKREVEDRFNRGADEQKRCVDADDEITRSPD